MFAIAPDRGNRYLEKVYNAQCMLAAQHISMYLVAILAAVIASLSTVFTP